MGVEKFSEIDKEKLFEKAKATPYRHKAWFKEGNKSVYDVMKYFVDSGDFYLASTAKYTSQIPGYYGSGKREDILRFLKTYNIWPLLTIRYMGKEGGSDKGKLKIMTYVALEEQKRGI